MSVVDSTCLIFSKDRAVQLLALLESLSAICLYSFCQDTIILYRVTTEQHRKQYDWLQNAYPNIIFWEEKNLEADIRNILNGTEYILFLIDDCLCIRRFKMKDALNALISHLDSIGFSLRLGTNILYCYPYGCDQKQPAFTELEDGILQFDWTKAECDFGYPMELSSSLYRTSDIIDLLQGIKSPSLKHIESFMWMNSKKLSNTKPNLLCFKTSCVFSNPLNVTATDPGNRFSERQEYTIEAMAEKFDEGYRIDIRPIYNFVPFGCHQEVSLSWIRR